MIEIASTTLSDDLGPKRLLYERLGVNEYWVVDTVVDTNYSRLTAFIIIDGGSREIRVSQVLPELSLDLVEEALQRSQASDDGEINRWLIQLFSQ